MKLIIKRKSNNFLKKCFFIINFFHFSLFSFLKRRSKKSHMANSLIPLPLFLLIMCLQALRAASKESLGWWPCKLFFKGASLFSFIEKR